jgi:hypothetical protein
VRTGEGKGEAVRPARKPKLAGDHTRTGNARKRAR